MVKKRTQKNWRLLKYTKSSSPFSSGPQASCARRWDPALNAVSCSPPACWRPSPAASPAMVERDLERPWFRKKTDEFERLILPIPSWTRQFSQWDSSTRQKDIMCYLAQRKAKSTLGKEIYFHIFWSDDLYRIPPKREQSTRQSTLRGAQMWNVPQSSGTFQISASAVSTHWPDDGNSCQQISDVDRRDILNAPAVHRTPVSTYLHGTQPPRKLSALVYSVRGPNHVRPDLDPTTEDPSDTNPT